jgi:hypothetical protein
MSMANRIAHLAIKADSYTAGAFIVLSFGNGSQVARVEGATKARLCIRRLSARGTENAAWELTTSMISKGDARIIGELPVKTHTAAQVPSCPTLAQWVKALDGSADRLTARAEESRQKAAAEGIGDESRKHLLWYATRDDKFAAKHRKEAAAMRKLIEQVPA